MPRPTTCWERPRGTREDAVQQAEGHAGEEGDRDAAPERQAGVDGEPAGEGADDHDALDAEVEDAGPLADELAHGGEDQRRGDAQDGGPEAGGGEDVEVLHGSGRARRVVRRTARQFSTVPRALRRSLSRCGCRPAGFDRRQIRPRPPLRGADALPASAGAAAAGWRAMGERHPPRPPRSRAPADGPAECPPDIRLCRAAASRARGPLRSRRMCSVAVRAGQTASDRICADISGPPRLARAGEGRI